MLSRLCSAVRRVATGGALLTILAGLLLVGLPISAHSGSPAGRSRKAVLPARLAAGNVATSDITMKVPVLAKPAAAARTAKLRSARASTVVARLPMTPTKGYGVVGVTWDGGYPTAGLTVQVRTHDRGGWSAWQHLSVDLDGPSEASGARAGTVPTWVGRATGIAVRLLSDNGTAPSNVRVALIDGGRGLAAPAGRIGLRPTAASTTPGAVAEPTIVTRAEWGSAANLPSCSSPRYAPSMRGVIIHHTVNANDYTPEEAPGIVRAIQLYHVEQMGWCDIGYNFLVDQYGVIYEGRRGGIDSQVRGAHAGNWDVNLYTTGIAMIGNFQTVAPSAAMERSVVRLTAWRLSMFGRRPFGKMTIDGITTRRVMGHRDVYLSGFSPATATACPGQIAYDWVHDGGMRRAVKAIMDKAAASQPQAPAAPTQSRLAGPNRYATAAAVASGAFPSGASTVFLTSGQQFPDALSAGPAAAKHHGPVLLTKPRGLPVETAHELQQLHPSMVYVVGGPAAVSDRVVRKADQYAGSVVRLGGKNRYGTGVVTTKRFWSRAGTVYLASGADYPDALSGGALAAHKGAPILLSSPTALPRVVGRELAALSPSRVVLLGGRGALRRGVADQVRNRLPGATVTRLAGADRYATSAKAASAGWPSASQVYFAVGTDFPDALAGVPAAAAHGSPLLLAHNNCLPAPVHDVVGKLGPTSEVLLGGSDVLASSAPSAVCP